MTTNDRSVKRMPSGTSCEKKLLRILLLLFVFAPFSTCRIVSHLSSHALVACPLLTIVTHMRSFVSLSLPYFMSYIHRWLFCFLCSVSLLSLVVVSFLLLCVVLVIFSCESLLSSSSSLLSFIYHVNHPGCHGHGSHRRFFVFRVHLLLSSSSFSCVVVSFSLLCFILICLCFVDCRC